MFLRYPSRKQQIPLRHLVPNMITTGALCCGLAAVHAAMRQEFRDAVLFVLASAILDALDGRAARLLKATSSFGSVMDSLSDFLSFGVAPSIIIYQWLNQPLVKAEWPAWALRYQDWFVLAACMIFPLCSAIRLARFTAAANAPKPDKSQIRPAQLAIASKFFVGLPTPAAAGCVLIPISLAVSITGGRYGLQTPVLVIFAFTIFISFLMVSRQPMFSFKKVRLSRAGVVPLFMLVGLVIVGVSKDVMLTLACLAGVYLLTFPLAVFKFHTLQKQAQLEAVPSGTLAPQP